jgi:hypothetical protein
MSANHLILAAIFAVLFIVPLAWLFLADRPRSGPPSEGDASEAPAATTVPAALD